ncbi:MAG: hypothetical protein AB7J30_14360 [Hyphomicrobium sp.]|uniref:hypothetical protein n=1 Tax=Hyphomicrobium sp. TaxID=82 RepID=UPI003D1031B7
MGATVVIGFAEALSAPEVAWSLLDAGFRVRAFARKGRHAALRHSRHVAVFEITAPEEDTAAALRELAAGLGTHTGAEGILLPLDDASVWLMSRLPPAQEWRLAGPSGRAAEMALDKQRQVEAAVAAGFAVPQSLFVTRPEELAAPPIPFPFILRPAHATSERNGRLAKGRNWICSDAHELDKARSAWKGDGLMLIQPYLDGVGEGVFGLATEEGVVAWSGHRRLRMMNPHGSGASACMSQSVPASLKEPVQAFIAACGWRGMFMVELLRAPDGQAWFVEFNGRAWGSMALARGQALEYPAWSARLALDPGFVPVHAPQSRDGVVARNLGRELMHLLFVLRGPRSSAMRNWPSVWSTLVALCRFDRNTVLYNAREWRVFLADAWHTVRDQLVKSPR